MPSFNILKNQTSCDRKNFTIASTFRKPKSVRIKLLFGVSQSQVESVNGKSICYKVTNRYFVSGSLFAISIKSNGDEFKKFHYCFVCRACAPGEVGTKIPGVSPGARILFNSLTMPSSTRFLKILAELKGAKGNVSNIDDRDWRRLGDLLDYRLATTYFLKESICGK